MTIQASDYHLSIDHHWDFVRLTKFEPKFLLTLTFFSFIFYSGNWGWGFGVTLLSHCHISHDMVTATVIDYEVVIEGSKRF